MTDSLGAGETFMSRLIAQYISADDRIRYDYKVVRRAKDPMIPKSEDQDSM